MAVGHEILLQIEQFLHFFSHPPDLIVLIKVYVIILY